jgi:RHH-type rel operon transcriptional repressor/antitoxin RelB
VAQTLSIRLPSDLARQLDALCDDTERPRTYIVRKAIESYLAEQADYQVALDRLRDRADPVLTADEVRKSLGR